MSHQNFITSSQSAWYFAREKFLASLLVRSTFFPLFRPPCPHLHQATRKRMDLETTKVDCKSMRFTRGIKICGQICGFVRKTIFTFLKIGGEGIIYHQKKKLQYETCASLINIWKKSSFDKKCASFVARTPINLLIRKSRFSTTRN